MSDPRYRRPGIDDMIAMYGEGRTLEEVGRKHGISRERVRQLLEREGVPRRKRPGPRRKYRVTGEQALAACRAPGVESFADAARLLNVPPAVPRRAAVAAGKHAALMRLFRLRTRARLIAELRVFAARLGRTPTAAELLHADGDRPCQRAYQHTFGSTSAAHRAAGLTPPPRGYQAHRARRAS